MRRDLCNFARIEFDRQECECIRELAAYAVQIMPNHTTLLTEDVDLTRKLQAMRRVVSALGAKIAGKKFQPVDLTKDECEAAYFLADGCLQALRENTLPNVSKNQRIGQFAVVLSRVKMKMSTAAELIKPNIATDARLN